MLILFDEAEKSFSSLGIGILKDAISCTVKEALNGEFELEMKYSVSGSLFSQIRLGRIILSKANPYDESQPFRIYSISKPINGIVSINASHISYDTNGILVKAVKGNGISEVISKIQNGIKNEDNGLVEPIVIGDNPFILKSDIALGKKFETTQPYNLRAILMGDDENSLLGVYKGEVKFNRFDITIMSKRGRNRGTEVRYGHNMTDLKHETSNELLYNKVYPYYYKETTKTENLTEEKFTQAYIVSPAKFEEGWLSYTKDGEPYIPVSDAPVQIATEGEYYERVYCWDAASRKYVEKIYNQSITLIDGVKDPTWMTIEWSLPTVKCRAKVNGYFKTTGEKDWSEKKYVGDEVLSISLSSDLMMSLASNFIIYFSEVLPTDSVTSSEEVTSSTLIELDEKIIDINTSEAKAMRYDRILQLDLTSEFEDEPTKEKLKQKALEYISENKVGTIKHTTEVSFIDLATTTEQGKYKNFEHVELGDTVKIVYEDLGVDTELRVISTEYNAITDRYNSVSLGTKEDNISSNTIQNGDSIKSLTNDAGYTDITEVKKLVADTITAEFLQAINAKLTRAQIQELSVERINCPGIIEASQYSIDNLVAKLLTADNAVIKETLEAGNIKLKGNMDITSGSINISNGFGITFNVDENGNVTSNSLTITGGKFDINNGMFVVTNDGDMTAKSGKIGDCVIRDGKLIVPAANIDGELTADKIIVKDKEDPNKIIFSADAETGEVRFNIIGNIGESIIDLWNSDDGDTVKIGGFTVTEHTIQNGTPNTEGYRLFGKGPVGEDGSYDMLILGTKFRVDKNGKVYATDGEFTGKIESTSGKIGALDITDTGLRYGDGVNTTFLLNPEATWAIDDPNNYHLYSKSIKSDNFMTGLHSVGAYSYWVGLNSRGLETYRIADTGVVEKVGAISTEYVQQIPYIYNSDLDVYGVNPRIMTFKNVTATSQSWNKVVTLATYGFTKVLTAVATQSSTGSVPNNQGNISVKIVDNDGVYVATAATTNQLCNLIIIAY